jgi:hypothetical protein
MEKYTLENDVNILYVTAKSFPDGIQEAYDALDKKLGTTEGRTFYGISYMYDGKIIYKAAAAENFDGEGGQLGCETMTVKKGNYLTETILDWKENMPAFGPTFQKLLDTPQLDQNSFCVEWYKSDKEVMCMVKLVD